MKWMLPESEGNEQVDVHGDSTTLESGVEDWEDTERHDEKEERDGDADHVEDTDRGVEGVVRNTVVVVCPGEVSLRVSPPAGVILTLLLRKLRLCIEQRMIPGVEMLTQHYLTLILSSIKIGQTDYLFQLFQKHFFIATMEIYLWQQ